MADKKLVQTRDAYGDALLELGKTNDKVVALDADLYRSTKSSVFGAAFPERFARVVVANTGLPIGTGWSEAFKQWLDFSQSVPEFPVGEIVSMGTVRGLSAVEKAAYDAPFPEESFKARARRFPALVPITPEHASVDENKKAWQVLQKFEKPFLTAFSDGDPVSKGGERIFHERVPGANCQAHVTIVGGGHFLQEDKPAELVALIDSFIRKTS